MSLAQNFKMGLAWQTSGDAVASVSSLQWVEHTNETLGREIPPLIVQGMRGALDEGDDQEGANTVAGELEIEARPIETGWFLKAMCGSYAVDEPDTGLFVHTFQPEQSDWDGLFAKQPMTIHKGMDVGSAQLFYDLNANVLEMTVANGDFLKAKLEFVGGQLNQVAESSPTYETGRRFTWSMNSLSIAGDGGIGAKFTELTININENLEAQHTLRASLYPSRIQRTDYRSIEISGTVKFDDQDEMQEFFSQSERELIATFEDTSVEVSSGYYNTLVIKAPRFKYREYKPESTGAGKVEVSFTGACKYDVESLTAIQFTLTNTQDTYA